MKPLHPWSVSISEAIRIQRILKEKIIVKGTLKKIKTIGGADVSYLDDEGVLKGVIVIYSYPDMDFLEHVSIKGKILFPYIPGLLSFREGPILIKAFHKLKIQPDLILFDGQGIAHPRGIGLASHLGLWFNLPTIGCAKKPLLKDYNPPGPFRGDFEKIFSRGMEVGAVLRTKDKAKPVFVSPGHKINLELSIKIVLNTCLGYRIPEPLRRAHLLSKIN